MKSNKSSTSSTRAEQHARRRFLRQCLALAGVAAAQAPLLRAATDPLANAFAAEVLEAALAALYGNQPLPTSDRIRIGVAKLAENGAVVPVKVEVDLPHAEEITLFASRNPVPLVARFRLGARTRPFIATRIKLKETSEIIAVVRTREGLWQAREPVEVTVGGCG